MRSRARLGRVAVPRRPVTRRGRLAVVLPVGLVVEVTGGRAGRVSPHQFPDGPLVLDADQLQEGDSARLAPLGGPLEGDAVARREKGVFLLTLLAAPPVVGESPALETLHPGATLEVALVAPLAPPAALALVSAAAPSPAASSAASAAAAPSFRRCARGAASVGE